MSINLFNLFFLIISEYILIEASNIQDGSEDGSQNEVINEEEKLSLMKKENDIYRGIAPLPSVDIKCLISEDRYCFSDMIIMKETLIQAVQEDCKRCPEDLKVRAGRIMAAMLIHDRAACKIFFTKYGRSHDVEYIFG